MLLGILSDSHGKAQLVRRAVELFDSLGVEHIIHCGDVGGQAVFEELVGRACTFVWGNTDHPDRELLAFLDAVGLPPPNGVPSRVTLAGHTCAVFHGHETGFEAALESLSVDYLFHGHTHVARDVRRGETRIINPGALVRANPKSVATLDLSADLPAGVLTFHRID